jgi:hypothetical protein
MLSKLKIPPEGTALLTLVRASLSARPSAVETFPSSLDWDFLQRLASHHRLEPLLYYGLSRSHFTGIPSRVRAQWEMRRRHAVARVLYHQEALRAIASAFEGQRLPFILLKGEAISKVLYPQDGLRPYGDIDLLIRREGYEAAKAILKELGFQIRHPTTEAERRRLFGEIEFDKEGPISLTVDLHWDTLMASWEPRSIFSEPETWASLDQLRLGNCAIPILKGEALLLYLSVHFAFHHVFDGLLLLCDLFLVLKRGAEWFDWDRVIALADRCQCRHALYYALFFAKALMNAQVPSQVLDRLRPPSVIRAIMPAGRLLFRDTLVPLMLERYVKFLLIDTQGGRHRALQVWLQASKGRRLSGGH